MTAALIVAALAVACAASDRSVSIGLAHRSLGDDAARLAALTLDTASHNNPLLIRLITDLPEAVRPPSGQLASEVDYARRLAAVPDLIAVVGHQGSREALLAAPIYREARIPVVIPTATSRRLRDTGPWTFTLAPNDSIEGVFIGALTARLGAQSALLFYVGDEYGVGLRDGIAASLASWNIGLLDAIAVEGSGTCSPVGQANQYAAIVDAALSRHRPEIILLATRQREGGCIMAQVYRQRPDLRFVGGDGILVDADFLSRAGRAADSMFVVSFWHPARTDPLSRDFAQRFRELAGREAHAGDAMIYDAVMVLAQAIRVAGPHRDRVRDYLASLGDDNGRSYHGVTGDVRFPAGPDRLVALRVTGGRLIPVEP